MYCFFSCAQSQVENENIDCVFIREQMPLFKGCYNDSTAYEEQRKCSDKKFLMFFHNNFRYPKEIQQNSFYMTIPIQWKFKKDGSVSNIEFLKESHPTLEKEARRVINLMPKWTPATQDGKPIEVCYAFPLRFHLE